MRVSEGKLIDAQSRDAFLFTEFGTERRSASVTCFDCVITAKVEKTTVPRVPLECP